MIPGPGESIYMWMYRQGLRGRALPDVVMDCMFSGHAIRPKDLRNYWNGWYRQDMHSGGRSACIAPDSLLGRSPGPWESYPEHPYKGKPEYQNCFVPCSAENKPLVKWSKGTMSLADAKAWPGSVYLAENMRGAQRIVIDIDGDHGDSLDLDIIRFFDRYRGITCCHEKREIVFDWFCDHEDGWAGDLHTAELPVSYHLTFGVDRVVPTMHFSKAHVDIIGNARNSLRYFKDKRYNGLPPLMMTPEIWEEITDFIGDMERRQR